MQGQYKKHRMNKTQMTKKMGKNG